MKSQYHSGYTKVTIKIKPKQNGRIGGSRPYMFPQPPAAPHLPYPCFPTTEMRTCFGEPRNTPEMFQSLSWSEKARGEMR